jgi:vacuolar protein 8
MFFQAYADKDKADTKDTQRTELADHGVIAILIAMLSIREVQADAALALMRVSRNTDNQVKVANEGGIGPLIALLRDGTAEGKTKAAAALYNLSFNADNRVKIRDAGLQIIQAAHDKEPDATVKREMKDVLDRIR